MPVHNRIAEFHDEMTAWRRDLHQYPEIGFEEQRTSQTIAERLRNFGLDEVVTGMATTGVVGVIHGRTPANGDPARSIGLRADIDALPIHEETGLPHASRTPNRMHACGHDGHATMLLGAAKYLAETRNFEGTAYVIFQPAEEGGGGGRVMVEEGLFTRFPMQRVFGMHNWPGLPEGQFAWRNGPVMAAVAELEATITGTGAHGAMPHQGNDPVVIAAQIVSALQSIVARNVDPAESGVITIGSIVGGDTWNVIPEAVRLRGTARWYRQDVGDLMQRKFLEIVQGIAVAFGGQAEARFTPIFPATINDAEATTLARRAAEAVAGEARVAEFPAPSMGGEDFSFMLNEKPGNYIMLGAGSGPQLHHPRYDFNDALLPVGASYWATLVEQLLPRRSAA